MVIFHCFLYVHQAGYIAQLRPIPIHVPPTSLFSLVNYLLLGDCTTWFIGTLTNDGTPTTSFFTDDIAGLNTAELGCN